MHALAAVNPHRSSVSDDSCCSLLALPCRETVDSAYTTHGWGGFPVHALRMQVPQPEPEDDGTHHYFLVPAGTVSSLTSLSSSLTALSLAGVRSVSPCVVEATPMRLAGVIKQLTGKRPLISTACTTAGDGIPHAMTEWPGI